MNKLSQKIVNLINEQINAELYSSYIYLDMSNFYYEKGFSGFGNWFKVQSSEEYEHALKFIDYLHLNSIRVDLKEVKKPEFKFTTLKDPLLRQLEHEEKVTSLINNIMEEAILAKDYRTIEFLNWFIKEQSEEEETAKDLLDKFTFIEENRGAIILMDESLKERK